MKLRWLLIFSALMMLSSSLLAGSGPAQAQTGSRTFPETGKTVKGRFLTYWNAQGGLAQQGFPISEELRETSDTDGKSYSVQYFERATFELHTENAAPNDVLLSLLGNFLYKQKYPSGAPGQKPNTTSGSVLFKETGKRLGGVFLAYWQTHGGLAQQGFPISDEFTEKSDLNGKSYTVQYFERAVFELHTENQPPYNVLLSQLGTFRYRAKYSQATATPMLMPPTATTRPGATSTSVPQPSSTPGASGQEVRLTIREWSITPNEVTVSAGKVEFKVTNTGAGMHNLKIRNAQGVTLAGTSEFMAAQSPQSFEVNLQPGTYTTFCSLPGHELQGQRGTVVVK